MPDVTVDILAQMEGADKVTRDLDKLNKEGEELHKTFSAHVLTTGFDRLEGEIEDSVRQVNRLGSAIEEVSTSKLANDAERVRNALEGANTEAGKLGRNVLNAQAPIRDIAPNTPDDKVKTGGGFRAQSSGQVLSGLSQVTGVSQLQGGADFVGLIDDGSEALTSLGAATIPAAVGVGAVAAGLVIFNAALKAGEKAVQEAVEANKEYGERLKFITEVSRLGGDELQSRVDQARRDLADQIQIQDNLTESLDRQREGFTYLQNVVANTGDVFGLGGAYESAADAADAAEDETRKLTETLAILEVAARDATAIDAAGRAVEIQNELNQLRKEGTEEEIRALMEQNHAESEIHQARRAAASQQLEEVNKLIAVFQSTGFNIPEELLARQELLETQYDEEQVAIDELADAYYRYNGILPEVIANTDALAASEARLADVTERLNEARESQEQRLQATQKAFQGSARERDQAEQQLLNTQSQLAALESDRAKQMERQAQQDALAASQDAREGALQAQIDAARVAETIQDIQQDASQKQIDIVQQTNEDILEAQNDLRKNVDKLNADWMRSELRAIQDFNLSQKRLREDTEADLKQAALDNDVNAFLSARDSAVTQLSRNGEDFAIERQRSKEDRDLQIQEMQITFQEQQAERRKQAEISLQQTRAEATARLQMETDAANGRLSQVQMLEQQLVNLRERFAQENRSLQERFNQEDHNARVRALNETLTINQNNFRQLEQQTTNLALAVGRAAAQGFFAGAQGTVDASIQVAINQAFVEVSQ